MVGPRRTVESFQRRGRKGVVRVEGDYPVKPRLVVATGRGKDGPTHLCGVSREGDESIPGMAKKNCKPSCQRLA